MPTPSPAIDPEAIDGLRALSPDDGDGFLKEIIAIFLEDTPVRISELRASVGSMNSEAFVRSAHSIKGSASNVGATELREISERIEHHGRKSGPSGAESMIAELEIAYGRVSDALQKIAGG